MDIKNIKPNQPIMLADGKMGLVTKVSSKDLTVGVQVPSEKSERWISLKLLRDLGGGALIQTRDAEPGTISIKTTKPPPLDIQEFKVCGQSHVDIVMGFAWEDEDEPVETYEMALIRARDGL
jgi:hypothetical protein